MTLHPSSLLARVKISNTSPEICTFNNAKGFVLVNMPMVGLLVWVFVLILRGIK
jgi:hypothetical protein